MELKPLFVAIVTMIAVIAVGGAAIAVDVEKGQKTSDNRFFDATPLKEVEAISAFMKAMPGLTSPFGHMNWDAKNPQNACQFNGVECYFSGVISRIHIDGFMGGTIPPEVGNFTYLTHFRLTNTGLTGTIPPSLSTMLFLESIQFSYHKLTGPLPDVRTMPALQSLVMDHGQLTGPLPEYYPQAKMLEWIWIEHNHISGTIPASWNSFPTLQYLDVSYNRLTGTIPGFTDSPELFQLQLNNNNLEGTLPVQLGPEVGEILFGANRLVGTIPNWNLTTNVPSSMNLSLNHLTGTIPDIFGPNKYWRRLDLSFNLLSGTLPPSLGPLQCRTLMLNNNDLDLCPAPPNFEMNGPGQCSLDRQITPPSCSCMKPYSEQGCTFECKN